MFIYQELDASTAFEIAKKFDDYNKVKFSQFKALFEFFESVLGDTPIEFYPIAWICDFRLYTYEEALKEYEVYSLDELEEKTLVIKGDDFVWIKAFQIVFIVLFNRKEKKQCVSK